MRLPLAVGFAGTQEPFHDTSFAALKTSNAPSVPVSPVSERMPYCSVAVRTRWVPRTSTGPAAVSWRQNVAAVALSASSRSSGRAPGAVTRTRVRPSWV